MTSGKKIRDYVDSNFTREVPIEQLSERFSLSCGYTCRLFKQETGETILRYIHRKRLELATRLLENTDLTIQEISIKCGYRTTRKFYQRFKKDLETTPGRYRKMKCE